VYLINNSRIPYSTYCTETSTQYGKRRAVDSPIETSPENPGRYRRSAKYPRCLPSSSSDDSQSSTSSKSSSSSLSPIPSDDDDEPVLTFQTKKVRHRQQVSEKLGDRQVSKVRQHRQGPSTNIPRHQQFQHLQKMPHQRGFTFNDIKEVIIKDFKEEYVRFCLLSYYFDLYT